MGMVLDQPDIAVVQAETEEPYAFTGAIMMGTNPLACMSNADLNRVYPVLNKLKFICVCDYHITPTIQMLADVALPVAMSVEKVGMIAKRTGACATSPIAGLEIKGEPRSDAQIALDLGKRFNPEMFPWETTEEIFDFLVRDSGWTWKDIRKMNWAWPKQEYRRYEKGLLRKDGGPGFNTSTGRIELYSPFAESIGENVLPYYDEPYYSPYTTPELYAERPIICMTGTRMIQFFHSEHRDVAKLREIQPDPWVEINDVWCKENGIERGDWVWVEDKIGVSNIAPIRPASSIRYGPMSTAVGGSPRPIRTTTRCMAFGMSTPTCCPSSDSKARLVSAPTLRLCSAKFTSATPKMQPPRQAPRLTSAAVSVPPNKQMREEDIYVKTSATH